MVSKKKQYLSDIISHEDIENWSHGDVITIKAGTGAGKSTFVIDKLYNHAKKNTKKILFLVHRNDTKEHFQKKLNKENKNDCIKLATYQTIENVNLDGWGKFYLSQYHYIVCDEFHYFMSDATFNKTTDISFGEIIEQNKAIKIMMSATGDCVTDYLHNELKVKTIDYSMDINFGFIKSLSFYNEKDSIHHYIRKAIKNNVKVILFFLSAKRAFELYMQYKDYAFFNCSKTNEKYNNYIDHEKVDYMLEHGKFDDLLLFTTIAMDTGVSIENDRENGFILNDIIVDGIRDIGVLKQCIGRKRLENEDDFIHLAVRGLKNNNISGDLKTVRKKLEPAECLKQYNNQIYSHEYGRKPDLSGIVYSTSTNDFTEVDKATFKINQLAYYKHRTHEKELLEMLNEGSWGYNKYIANELGFDYEDCVIYEDKKLRQSLEEYLESVVGKRLYKEDQKQLINQIDLRVNGRQQKSYSKLNEGLEMINVNYTILPKKSGNVRYWIVEKIER